MLYDAQQHDSAGKKVMAVRYVDRLTGQEYEQPADVVMLGAFTMSNTKLLLASGSTKPYDPVSNNGVVQRTSATRWAAASTSS